MPQGKLNLIDLDQKAEGYRKFLSCWVWQGDDLTYIVDPGPKSTIGHLEKEIRALGISKIDYVLLTHIHLDHGGGCAEIMEAFPGSRLYCHPAGVKHMVDPTRLWQGSIQVLKEVAEMYQEPKGVSAESIVDEEELAGHGIQVIMTPGHAVHHVSFVHDDIIYAGEALGVFHDLGGEKPYLRPATPPRFFLEQAMDSLDKLSKIEKEPQITAFAHHGQAKGFFRYVKLAKIQLLQWVDEIKTLKQSGIPSEELEPALFEKLMKEDPLYGLPNFDSLDPDMRNRERHFLQNTIDGIEGYLKSQ